MLIDLSPLRRHRDYRLLFFGQAVSLLGTMLTTVAIPFELFEHTHSSWLVGMLGTAQLVPLVATALWGGALADAMDRRRLLLVSELLLAVCSLGLCLNALRTEPSVPLIFVLAATMAAVNGFHRPALDAMTPKLVERDDMPAVSALGSLRRGLGSIAGPALAGVCIATLGLPATYALDFLSFGASLAALASIRAMPAPESAPRPGLASIAEGLRYAVSRPELIGTYVVDMVAMTFAMPMALFPALAAGWGGATAAGWLFAAMSIGSVGVTLLSGRAGRVTRHGAAVVVAAAAWGVAIIGLGFAPNLPVAVACLALAGAADMVSGLYRMTIWNQTIPSELRGRLAGVEMISYMSGPLLGNARAGWVASTWGTSVSVVSGGLLCTAGVLLCIPLLPGFWRYRARREA